VSESVVAVTEGSGKNLQSWSRVVSSSTVQDQFVLPGAYPYATYVVLAENISIATASDHVVQLMAGSSLYVRVHRIRVTQHTLVTTANADPFQVIRLTSAGSGGSSITPAKFDTGDASAGASAQSLPSSKGTESTTLLTRSLLLTQTAPTAGGYYATWEWTQSLNAKPIIIAAGTSNGLVVKNNGSRPGATVDVEIEFTETSYL
jgi:hypothetical protein